jgi:mono/diheme cytochrome c family protein
VSLRALVVLCALAAPLLGACDESVAFREPDPQFDRMLDQRRADPYEPSEVFDDGQAMRRPPAGVVAHGVEPNAPPPQPTRELVDRGRARFETFCAACHGILGDGQSVVATKMPLRRPPSLHEQRLRALPPPAIVAVIENGYGFMPSYADAIDRRDRFAVAYYVKALQLARGTKASDLSPPDRAELEKEAPRP